MPSLNWEPDTTRWIAIGAGADILFRLPAVTPAGAPSAWPDGTVARLEILDSAKEILHTAPALVSPEALDFDVQAEVVEPLLDDARRFRIVVTLPDTPDRDFITHAGPIKRKD